MVSPPPADPRRGLGSASPLLRTRVSLFFGSLRLLRWLSGLLRRLESVLIGFWLGMLSYEDLLIVDDMYYVGQGRQHSPVDYRSAEWNTRGLFGWEQEAVTAHFAPGASLMLLAAGGGREVLALRRLSYAVDAWECQPDLVVAANALLSEEGLEAAVRHAPRDTVPPGDKRYDGAVVGWGAYTHTRGRSARVKLLRDLRKRVRDDSPVLLSFWVRRSADSSYRVVAAVGNLMRVATGGPRIEIGDYLGPNFVHVFEEQEIRSELAAAGFELICYRTKPYGHAVGRAVP